MPDPAISPAEAFILLNPPCAVASEAFKIAFLSLVSLGVLRITMVERKGILRTKNVPVVSVERPAPEWPGAAEIVSFVRNAKASSVGIQLPAIAAEANTCFGAQLFKLKTEILLPALVRSGLLELTEKPLLWVFRHRVHTLTPRGVAEQQRIETLLDAARRLPALLDTDPAEARAIALAAGPYLLLLPELRQHYRRLAALDVDATTFDSSAAYDHAGQAWCDFSDFDTSCLDLDFSSFDSGFDSGGGGDDGGGGHSH